MLMRGNSRRNTPEVKRVTIVITEKETEIQEIKKEKR
jgi:hypothetical protein